MSLCPIPSPDVATQAAELARKIEPTEAEEDTRTKALAALERARATKLTQTLELKGDAVDALTLYRQSLKAALDPDWAKKHPHIVPARVKTADVPMLHKLLRELEDETLRLENPEIAQAGTTAVVDSVRVRIAKETGASLDEAVLADCREVIAILTQQRQPPMSFAEVEAERQAAEQQAPDTSKENAR